MSDTLQVERKLNPESLGLREGMGVEVLTAANYLVFMGKVKRIQDGAVILRDAKGDDVPQVVYGQDVKLRFLRNGETAMLQGKVCGSTPELWKVDRLEVKFTKEQRAFFRQGISASVQARCIRRSPQGVRAKDSTPCQVLDVSAGGLLFSSSELYEKGQRLTLAGVRLVQDMEPFEFNCQVRRVGKPKGGTIRYGCQFERLAERDQDRLLRAIFIVQREEIRLQKGKGRLA